MPYYRRLVLHATREGARLHKEHNMRDEVERTGGRIDVFGTLVDLGVPLLFRPLKGLLGAYITNPAIGVLVTTRRQLSVQRFTGAHELGHFILGHEESLDGEEMLGRSPFGRPRYDPCEIEADAFASHFLMPRWIFEVHASRQGWTRSDMANPLVSYQMSLRVGASYSATCFSLERHGIIDRTIRSKMLNIEVRKIKQELLAGVEPENWHPDVWLLTAADEGAVIEGGPNDLFVLRLKERISGGYVWRLDDLKEAGFAVVRDKREIPTPEKLGTAAMRVITTQSLKAQAGHLSLSQTRPWQNHRKAAEGFSIDFDLQGKESGLPRAQRRVLPAA